MFNSITKSAHIFYVYKIYKTAEVAIFFFLSGGTCKVLYFEVLHTKKYHSEIVAKLEKKISLQINSFVALHCLKI